MLEEGAIYECPKSDCGCEVRAEHGGSVVSGGGHPSADAPPASEAIDDAFAQDARGHGNTPGVGVPGSKSNPVMTRDGITARAHKIWEEEGHPAGRADEHWHQAEQELRGNADHNSHHRETR